MFNIVHTFPPQWHVLLYEHACFKECLQHALTERIGCIHRPSVWHGVSASLEEINSSHGRMLQGSLTGDFCFVSRLVPTSHAATEESQSLRTVAASVMVDVGKHFAFLLIVVWAVEIQLLISCFFPEFSLPFQRRIHSNWTPGMGNLHEGGWGLRQRCP